MFMTCVFGRLMSQLADVNTQSTVGMWHFYIVLHCCFCHWCRVLTFCGTLTSTLIPPVKKRGLWLPSEMAVDRKSQWCCSANAAVHWTC